MKVANYFKDCKAELKKVTWPTKKEVASSTRVVLISTVVSALLLGTVDFLVARLITLIFR